MAYTKEFKIATLNHAKEIESLPRAAKAAGIDERTIYRWNRKYKICEVRQVREFSVSEKIEILDYANKHGLTGAMQKFDIAIHNLLMWNKDLKIYEPIGRRVQSDAPNRYERVSLEKKLEILKYVKDNDLVSASKKYNKAISTIQYWNSVLKVYKTREHRIFTPEDKEAIIQDADKTSIADAAKKYKLRGHQIQEWIKDKIRSLEQ